MNSNQSELIDMRLNMDGYNPDVYNPDGYNPNGKPHSTRMRPKVSSSLRYWCRCCVIIGLILATWVYIGCPLYLNTQKSLFVCILGPGVTFYLINRLTKGKLAHRTRVWKKRYLQKPLKPRAIVALWIRRISTFSVVIGIAVFLAIDIGDEWSKWIPLGGLTVLVILSVVGSKSPNKVNWTTVVWGIILQFSFGLLILRWKPGFSACQWLGRQVTTLLSYTDIGSEFVFGEKYIDHPVILPTVVLFSSLVSILYHLGAMQAVIKVIATVLQFFLNATPIESFATAAHIFIGQTESSIALKPFWYKLTLSEIHAIMTGGFATVAGAIIAAYVDFGIPPEHVISASFMSAPAAIAVAKISFPETEISQIKTRKAIKLDSSLESNLIGALSVGATVAVKMISFVVVNIIAFIAVFGLLDGILSYFGSLLNCPQLSFQSICSYVFMPVAAMIGIPWSETSTVGALIGKKIFLNELLSYADLGALRQAGKISDRSAVLSTYILCGFGSISALGINIGSLSSAAPDMAPIFTRLVLRSMINGNIACFMTACVAGLLYQGTGPILDLSIYHNTTMDFVNMTSTSFVLTNTTI